MTSTRGTSVSQDAGIIPASPDHPLANALFHRYNLLILFFTLIAVVATTPVALSAITSRAKSLALKGALCGNLGGYIH